MCGCEEEAGVGVYGAGNSRSGTLVWTAVIVMKNPLPKNASEVSRRERDQKIQAFSAGSPHQSFAETIGLRTSHRRTEHSHAHAFQSPVQFLRVDPIAVMNQVPIGVISGQLLAELLQRPVCCRMIRHVMMHDPACPHLHDHEYIQKPECGVTTTKSLATIAVA